MRRLRVLAGVVGAVLGGFLSGCTAGPGTPSLTVFAAASLQPAFTEIGEQFKIENPGTTVAFNFAGSSDLATQLTQGARADVFASANTAQMGKVADAGLLAGNAAPFAANTLVIVTAPGNPKQLESFADLARPGLAVVVCQAPVPCGAAAHEVETASGVHVRPVSEEPDVTDVLNKVVSGQADAGLVYRTDAIHARDKVATVTFPEATGLPAAVNTYPIAVLKDTAHPELGRRFVDLVTGATGQRILHAAGFAKP